MLNLFNITNVTSNGFLPLFLDILSLLSIIFGISVINSKNPIVSVLFLIGLFISISLNLILLGYNFIGLSYLLVYVGAISILFLFILMLINIRISELLNDTRNSIPLAIFTGFTFFYPVYLVLNNVDSIKDKYLNKDIGNWLTYDNSLENFKNSNLIIDTFNEKLDKSLISSNNLSGYNKLNNQQDIFYAISNTWDDNLIGFNDITSVANVLYSTYGIWLIICSIILLLAMIGAITITKKEKN